MHLNKLSEPLLPISEVQKNETDSSSDKQSPSDIPNDQTGEVQMKERRASLSLPFNRLVSLPLVNNQSNDKPHSRILGSVHKNVGSP